jgi:hypothetical protein
MIWNRKGWSRLRNLMGLVLILSLLGLGAPKMASAVQGRNRSEAPLAFQLTEDEEPQVNANSAWKVNIKERVSACDNRPGLKKIYVTVLDEKGDSLRGVKVRFETEPSEGIVYDHMNIWGLTDEDGYAEWDHLGIPTRYMMFVEDEVEPVIWNIRTDLGNEYCRQRADYPWSYNPVNRPGIHSYRLEIQLKGQSD